MGQIVIIVLPKASIQVTLGQVHGAEPRLLRLLDEEVVDKGVVVALVVPIVGVRHFLTLPAAQQRQSLCFYQVYSPARRMSVRRRHYK